MGTRLLLTHLHTHILTHRYLVAAVLRCVALFVLFGAGMVCQPLHASTSRQASAHTFPVNIGWQFVASPFTFSESFSDMGIFAAVWRSAVNRYSETPTPPADTFRLGQGCWIYITRDVTVPSSGIAADSSRPFSIALAQGWNQVGNPFVTDAGLSTASVTPAAGGSMSFSEAAMGGVVSPLYAYDPQTGNYVVLLSASQALPAWSGAWIYSFEPTTLTFAAPGGAPGSLSVSAVAVEGQSASSTLAGGSIPTGSSAAPTSDTNSVLSSPGTVIPISIRTSQPIDVVFVSLRGSGSFAQVLLSAASRQSGGGAQYRLQVALNGVPSGPVILDVTTGTGELRSQPVSITNVPVGNKPYGIGVNPLTNRVYVANEGDDSVTVLDGSTDAALTNTPVGSLGYYASAVVNSSDNRIYVPNEFDNTVSVLDGNSNNVIATVPVGSAPRSIAVDPALGQVYTADNGDGTMTIIDEQKLTTRSVLIGQIPLAIAVDPVNHRVYIADQGANTLSVLDGGTAGVVASLPLQVGLFTRIAIDSTANLVYITNSTNNTLTVVDGSTNVIRSVLPVGSGPSGLAVDPAAQRVYVSLYNSDSVAIIDSVSDSILDVLAVGSQPTDLTLNPATSQLFVTNSGDNTISVVDGAVSR